MPSISTETTQTPHRLDKSITTHGPDILRSTKRKAEDEIDLPRKKTRQSSQKSPIACSPTAQLIKTHQARYTSARQAAVEIFHQGHSRNVAMQVFDQVYHSGFYTPATIGQETKPIYDWSDPRTSRLDKATIDQIWDWRPRWSDKAHDEELVSPTSQSRHV